MSNLSLESQRLRVEIEQRRDLLTKLNSEEKIVEGEKIKAGNLNSRLLKEIDQYSVPGVHRWYFLTYDHLGGGLCSN